MSKNYFSRTRSFRKSIKPVIDIYEDEDDKRRDSFGRKRVDVIQCLLESSSSSSDENDDTNIINENSHNILWLTFAEICHIRSVLAQTALSILIFNKDKQYSKIIHGHVCFRCRKLINSLFFIPSFFSSTNSFICYVCQQKFCKNCSLSNFLPPLSKHSFPVRIQTLIKTTTTSIDNEISKENELNRKRKSICYDCSQVRFKLFKQSMQQKIS
jgi:hypothetical protein